MECQDKVARMLLLLIAWWQEPDNLRAAQAPVSIMLAYLTLALVAERLAPSCSPISWLSLAHQPES